VLDTVAPCKNMKDLLQQLELQLYEQSLAKSIN